MCFLEYPYVSGRKNTCPFTILLSFFIYCSFNKCLLAGSTIAFVCLHLREGEISLYFWQLDP